MRPMVLPQRHSIALRINWRFSYNELGYRQLRNIIILACVVLFVILVFVTAALALSGQHGRFHTFFVRIDLVFGKHHRVALGHPIVRQQTASGGFFTIVLVGLVVMIWMFLILQFGLYNTEVAQSLQGGFPPENPFIATNFTFVLDLLGYGGQCAPGIAIGITSGITCRGGGFYNYYSAQNSTCTYVQSGIHCQAAAAVAQLQLSFVEPLAYATAIRWRMDSIPVAPLETNSVGGFVSMAAVGAVLAGQIDNPLYLEIDIYNTIYTNLAGTDTKGIRLYPGLVGVSTAITPSLFYANIGQMNFQLQMNQFNGYAQLQDTQPISAVQFVVSLFSLSSAVFSAVVVALMVWERVLHVRVARGIARLRAESATQGRPLEDPLMSQPRRTTEELAANVIPDYATLARQVAQVRQRLKMDVLDDSY